MKSIGEHLRTAREEKGFSFDQVVHDTNISREYIHALEEDNFDFFPAEAYLIGFLRNYSEYLGLEPSKMVGIYKNFKISEEQVPMDLLLGKKKAAPEKKEKQDDFAVSAKKRPIWIIPVLALVLILAGAAIVFLPSFLNRESEGDSAAEVSEQRSEEIEEPKEFFLTEETLDIIVSDGDKINVSTGTNMLTFNVNFDRDGKYLVYQDIENTYKKMDLKNDTEQVILIDEQKGVYFNIKNVSETSVTLIAQKVTRDESSDNTAAEDEASVEVVPDERIAQKTVITTESYPKAYTVDVFFRGDGLFRYKNDGQSGIERFFQAGERLKVEVNRSTVLWASNAGIVDLKISGKEISLGNNGQVVVRSVKWINNNETGKYELVILPKD